MKLTVIPVIVCTLGTASNTCENEWEHLEDQRENFDHLGHNSVKICFRPEEISLTKPSVKNKLKTDVEHPEIIQYNTMYYNIKNKIKIYHPFLSFTNFYS